MYFEEIINTLEQPVRKAVMELLGLTVSSGFHHTHDPQAWGIVFEGVACNDVIKAAKKAGLEVRFRNDATDVWLANVREDEPQKAQKYFDEFRDYYRHFSNSL